MKKGDLKPASSESSEKLSSSQPQPPSSPAQDESKRASDKGERGAKRCLKNKPAGDEAGPDSAGRKGGSGDASSISLKPATTTTAEQQTPEPSAKRTTKRSTSPAETLRSVKPDGKAPPTQLPVAQSPQTRHKDGDNRAERLGGGEEQKCGGSAAASCTNTSQVRKIVSLI